jgi:hypothetical protein
VQIHAKSLNHKSAGGLGSFLQHQRYQQILFQLMNLLNIYLRETKAVSPSLKMLLSAMISLSPATLISIS